MTTDKPVTIFNARLPDALEERASALREQQYLSDFEKGDLANDVYTWALASGIKCTIQNACSRVAMMLDGAGQGAYRIYDLAQLAQTYKTNRQRRRYAILPISHLEWAATFPAEIREAILERDLKSVDTNGGRPISLKNLQLHPDVTQRTGLDGSAFSHGVAGHPDFDYGREPEHPGTAEHQPDLIPVIDELTLLELQGIVRQLRMVDIQITRTAPSALKLLKPIIAALIDFTAALARARAGEAIPVDVAAEIIQT